MATGNFGSNSGESLDQALDRIAGQIARGERDFDSVRRGIGNASVGMGGGGDQAAIAGGAAAIRARLAALYANTGITAETYNRGTSAPSTGQIDSFAYWKDVLAQYNLEGLAPTIESWVRDDVPPGEIAVRLRTTPEFKQRFPGIEARLNAGLPAVSPADYLNYEQGARQAMMQAGLPEGFYDEPSDFTDFLVRDMSVSEVASRVQNGFAAVANAPAAVKDAFREFFGAEGDGALAAYFLDPSKALPVLERRIATAQIGGAGKQLGFDLGLDRATQIAEAGVGFEGARQGFERLSDINPLFDETISETADFRAEREGVDSTFGVGDATAKEKLRRRLEQRQAAFAGSGSAGAASSQRGAIGLGAADSR